MIRNCSLLAFSIFICTTLYSCSSRYALVKSNRTEYPISTALQADSAMIRKYQPYKLKMDSQMNAVIGYTDVALTKKGQSGEYLLGNFFADATFAEAKKIDPQIDFTLPTTNGGLRNDLPLGKLTLANVFELMPFENELLIFELKGSDVQSLLNYIADTQGQPVAGIRLKINNKKATDIFINGQAFDPAKNYHVLTSDYIASGGDRVESFKNPVSRKVLGLKVRDALIQYIKQKQAAGQKVSATLDGRISRD